MFGIQHAVFIWNRQVKRDRLSCFNHSATLTHDLFETRYWLSGCKYQVTYLLETRFKQSS